MKKVILPLIILLVGVGIAALLVVTKRDPEQVEIEVEPPLVRVLTTNSGEHQFRVQSQGTVKAKTEIPLMSEVDGSITAVSPALAEGGFFRKGEELVTLDSRDFELAVTRAKALVAAAKVQVEIIAAEASVAESEWEDLGGGRIPSELLLRKPQLEEASATLEGAKADLDKANLDLQRTHIVAPFDGRVREKIVDLGQFVRRGDRVASIFSVDTVEVSLPLPLGELAYLDLPLERNSVVEESDLPEVVLTGNYAGKTQQWKGRIVRQDGEIDSVSRMARVIVEVLDPYGLDSTDQNAPLKVGMFVEAEILGSVIEDAFVIPRTALRSGNEVWLVEENGDLTNPLISNDDLKLLSSFAAKLARPKSPVSKFIHEQLATETTERLEELEDSNEDLDQLRIELVDSLNVIIKGPAIYSTNIFGGMTLQSDSRILLDQFLIHSNSVDSASFNRLLLEDAYPHNLPRYVLHPVKVEVLRVGREESIINGGLREGDRVVLSPLETPIEGMALRIAVDEEGGAQ